MIDKWSLFPISAIVYITIVGPLLTHYEAVHDMQAAEPEWHNRVVWPVLTASSITLAALNRSYTSKRALPPNIICLLAYVVFAGASVLWSVKPEFSFIRFTQQAMIVTSIILPAMLAVRTADVMRSLFLCFALVSILNVLFLPGSEEYDYMGVFHGYHGYVTDKNSLGQFAAIAFLFALREIICRGVRRVLGIIAAVTSIILLVLSSSKSSLGFALFAPFLGGVSLIAGKRMRVSPAIVLLSIAFCSAALSKLSGYDIYGLAGLLYGDPTFSGRKFIWDFAKQEIDRRPFLGWGYQSFWLTGPDAPSMHASGWIKMLPHAHNGYYDTMLQMGYVGLTLLVICIIANLHCIGRLADRDPARAWLMLSLIIFIIIHNFQETSWMWGGAMLWLVFIVVAAEIGRCWRLYEPTTVTCSLRSLRSTSDPRKLTGLGGPTNISGAPSP
jgi:O-antigen ligase